MIKIAIIGSNQTEVKALAEQLAEKYDARILINQKDDMLELLKLDLKKYFTAYQLHLLLNRIYHLQESGNVIICDTLFTDYCAMNAALASGIITAPEYKLYKQKHDEFMHSFSDYDYVYYIEDDISLQQIEAPFSNLSINYWKLCANNLREQTVKLKEQLKDRFITLPAAKVNMIEHEETEEVKTNVNHKEETDEADLFIKERLEELLPNVHFVASANEIQELIWQYQRNVEISCYLPCICIESNCCTCIKLTYDEHGEEIISCQKKNALDDIIAFFND